MHSTGPHAKKNRKAKNNYFCAVSSMFSRQVNKTNNPICSILSFFFMWIKYDRKFTETIATFVGCCIVWKMRQEKCCHFVFALWFLNNFFIHIFFFLYLLFVHVSVVDDAGQNQQRPGGLQRNGKSKQWNILMFSFGWPQMWKCSDPASFQIKAIFFKEFDYLMFQFLRGIHCAYSDVYLWICAVV